MKKILFILGFLYIMIQPTFAKDLTIAVVGSGYNEYDKLLNCKLWTNPNEIPCNGIDDDNNGYIDDYNGWNFADNNGDLLMCGNNDYHETAVIQDMINYNNGYVYDNDNISIMILKVRNGSNMTQATMKQVAQYAVDCGADIISLSLDFDMDDPSEFDELVASYPNTLIIKAAGNDRINYSNNHRSNTGNTYNNLIVVGALDDCGKLADYSNFGTGVDVYIDGNCYPANGSILYKTMQGTSFAVPKIVSQCCTLWQSNPEATPKDIKRVIREINVKVPL